jgi:hypothetical protein
MIEHTIVIVQINPKYGAGGRPRTWMNCASTGRHIAPRNMGGTEGSVPPNMERPQ